MFGRIVVMFMPGKLKWFKYRYIELLHISSRTFFNTFNTVETVKILERKDSADFVRSNLDGALLFSSRTLIQNYAAQLASDLPGTFLELGVFTGNSLKRMSNTILKKKPEALIVGIDSFRGLQENWSDTDSFRAFDLDGKLPKGLDSRIKIIDGLVEEKLDDFIALNDENISLLHIDLDLYAPTKFALDKLKKKLTRNTLILFDDMHGYPGWRFGEYRALLETYTEEEYKFLAFGPYQALIQLN